MFLCLRFIFVAAIAIRPDVHVAGEYVHQPVLQFDFDSSSCKNGQVIANTMANADDAPPAVTSVTKLRTFAAECSRFFGIESRNAHGHQHTSSQVDADWSFTSTFVSQAEPGDGGGDGLLLELWFEPFAESFRDFPSPILIIGDNGGIIHHAPDNANSLGCVQQPIDFQLSQFGHNVEVLFRTAEAYFEPCQRLLFMDVPLIPGQLNHVVVALQDKLQQIIINGHGGAISQAAFANDLSHWNDQSKLSLFPTMDVGSWSGRIYRLSIYDQYLDETQIRNDLIRGGPPDIPAYVLSTTVTVPEHITTGEGGLDINALQNDYRIDLPIKNVPAEHQNMIDAFQSDCAHVHHGQQQQRQQQQQRITTLIVDVPDKGRLYAMKDDAGVTNQTNTINITHVPFGLPTKTSSNESISLNSSISLFYIPPPNQHSSLPGIPYTSFTACTTTSFVHAGTEDACQPATVTIIVEDINNVPTAIARLAELHLWDTEIIGKSVQLSGRDDDENDSIQMIQITRTPTRGYLILSTYDRTTYPYKHGTIIHPSNATTTTLHSTAIAVEYRPHSNSLPPSDSSGIEDWSDTFAFRAADTAGTWSEERIVTIRISPSLQVDAPTPILTTSHQPAVPIHIGIEDHSFREIGIEVISLPQQGRLYSYLDDGNDNNGGNQGVSNNGQPVLSNSIVTPKSIIDNSIRLFYQPSSDCTGDHNVSFLYRGTVLQHPNETTTAIQEQQIQVICTKHSIALSPIQHRSSHNATILQVQHTQGDVRVLLKVSCGHGLLTWNDTMSLQRWYRHYPQRRSVLWIQQDMMGDSNNNNNNTSGLVLYRPNGAHRGEDVIVVTAYYGCDFDDANEEDAGAWEMRLARECYNATQSTEIDVTSDDGDGGKQHEVGKFQWMSLPFTLGLIVLMKLQAWRRTIK